MSTKGAAFEREISYALSHWWSGGKRDDLFWRTHGSGARATSRGKRGKQTAGQYGDICASDPAGADLLKLFTFSLKTGYARETLQDLVDDPMNPASRPSAWPVWVHEAMECSEQAGVPFWAVISKRVRRDPIIVLPKKFRHEMGLPRKHEMYVALVGEVSVRKLSWFFDLSRTEIRSLL
jgi:hypothetical protein